MPHLVTVRRYRNYAAASSQPGVVETIDLFDVDGQPVTASSVMANWVTTEWIPQTSYTIGTTKVLTKLTKLDGTFAYVDVSVADINASLNCCAPSVALRFLDPAGVVAAAPWTGLETGSDNPTYDAIALADAANCAAFIILWNGNATLKALGVAVCVGAVPTIYPHPGTPLNEIPVINVD